MRALDPDNASIMVCGGAGVALSTTRKAKDMGAWVWMMQRSDNLTSEIEKMMAFKVKGDAMDKSSVMKAMSSMPFAMPWSCTHVYAFPTTQKGKCWHHDQHITAPCARSFAIKAQVLHGFCGFACCVH